MKIYPVVYSIAMFLFLDENYTGVPSRGGWYAALHNPHTRSGRPSSERGYTANCVAVVAVGVRRKLVNRSRVVFVLSSATAFLLLTGVCYWKYVAVATYELDTPTRCLCVSSTDERCAREQVWAQLFV